MGNKCKSAEMRLLVRQQPMRQSKGRQLLDWHGNWFLEIPIANRRVIRENSK